MASISTQTRNIVGSAIVNAIDQGTANPNAYLEIRTGSKPESPQVAATGTLLATFDFSFPSFNSFANGVAFARPIVNSDGVISSGIAGWFRIFNRDGVAVIDGSISEVGGDGDIQFDSINFILGGAATIPSLRGTVPQ
jgi:hypothetical protein